MSDTVDERACSRINATHRMVVRCTTLTLLTLVGRDPPVEEMHGDSSPMLTIGRALRSIARNPVRSGMMVAILAACVGLALIMLTVNAALSQRMDTVSGQVGSELTVRPAGSFGGFGRTGGDEDDQQEPTLTTDAAATIAGLEHVADVASTLAIQWMDGSLVAGQGTTPTNPQRTAAGFSRPIVLTGTDSPDNLEITGGGTAVLTIGSTWTDEEQHADVAVIGQSIAEANDLSVGSSFDVNGTAVTVIGIFSSGQQFGDNGIFMPISTAQRLLNRAGEVSSMIVFVTDVDEAEAVAEGIRAALGTDVVDVVTPDQRSDAIIGSLTDASATSRTGLIAALVVSAAVIVFSVGLATRQRMTELGILKALGASNVKVVAQFTVESLTLTLAAACIGAVLTYPAAQAVANALVESPQAAGAGGIQGFGQRGGAGVTPEGRFGDVLGDVTVVVSPEIFLYALGVAIALAIVAGIVPAWSITRVKPAEVLRHA